MCRTLIKSDYPRKQIKFQEFDSGLFNSDEEVIMFIQSAIDILRENLSLHFLVFDEVCNPDYTNGNRKFIPLIDWLLIQFFWIDCS